MKPITSVNVSKNSSCCGTANSTVAQCCSKNTKIVAGCHD